MADNTFAVARDDIRKTRTFDDEAGTAALSETQVRLRVGPFALTSNNVTYGKLGDAFGYFQFYPSGDESDGRIPVWGFGDVVESRVAGVEVGTRVYGFFPISTHVILEPVVDARGFADGAAHRAALPPIYNHYTPCEGDPLYRPEHEAHLALLRPLFSTAFLLDDHIAENEHFGADHVLLSSASSKTAYATAHRLSRRRGAEGATHIVGITSAANRAFVERLGCYDSVVTYDGLDALPDGTAAFVDIAGNGALRAAVHERYGDALKSSQIVGATHWDAPATKGNLPGPKPGMFFAPTVAAARMQEWGPAGLATRLGAAWAEFVAVVADTDAPWLRVVRREGLEATIATYRALLEGESSAEEGFVLSV